MSGASEARRIDLRTVRNSSSVVAFGRGPIGGPPWGNVDETQTLAAIHAAMDEGVNFIESRACDCGLEPGGNWRRAIAGVVTKCSLRANAAWCGTLAKEFLSTSSFAEKPCTATWVQNQSATK